MTARKITRVGDTGEGYCSAPSHEPNKHFTTTFRTGFAKMTVNGRQVCVIGTIGDTTCGHTTRATTGSGKSSLGGIRLHRVGDTGIVVEDPGSTYTAITGSPNFDCS